MDAATPIPATGEYAPWFHAKALSGSDRYAFHTVAGRAILMLFFGSACGQSSAEALRLITTNRAMFDDHHACFFGVTTDPTDVSKNRIAQALPGIRYFLDFGNEISAAFGAAHENQDYAPHWVVLDKELRIRARYRIDDGDRAIADLKQLIGSEDECWAPVITVPDVLDRETCRRLIELYESQGGDPSGFMRDVDGKTTLVLDDSFKRRKDCRIEDPDLVRYLAMRVERRIRPAIHRAFQFNPTRIERYIVACYEAGAGHFRPHRDNTTHGTAHRRFAVTINLNADDYDGGDLRFPEFGQRTYRAPTGGAVVFSCSLLHEATPVTRGTRYAFLPFLYDEAARKIREANLDKFAPKDGQEERSAI